MGSWIRFEGNVSRTRVRVIASTLLPTSRDGGHDRHRAAVLEGGLLAGHEADVFLGHVDVDEAAQLAALVHQPLLEARELALEGGADAVHRAALGGHLSVALRALAQRRV